MQKEKLAQQLATELKFLRAQISPHFLFNVLTNLMALARKQSDQLEPALIRLSDLMRYMLYNSQAKKVALQQEIEYLNSYIQLQKLRFGNDIPIITHITRPVSLQDYRIAAIPGLSYSSLTRYMLATWNQVCCIERQGRSLKTALSDSHILALVLRAA